MQDQKTLNNKIEKIGWGAVLICWGVAELKLAPAGVGMMSIGVILLGLNAARALNGIRTSGLTIALGVAAVVLGALTLAQSVLGLPFEIPGFAILLIVAGVVVLTRGIGHNAMAASPK